MAEETKRTWTEAPASWNIKFRINGFEEQITLRSDSYSEIVPTIDKARAYVTGLIGAAPSRKATEDAVNVESPAPFAPLPNGGEIPIKQNAQAGVQNRNSNALTFEVERMEANVNAGKVSWRCKGGHFTQYGVICWPEVLKAANMNLDPTKGAYTFNPPLVAEYALKDDGKPQKVTRLYQKQA